MENNKEQILKKRTWGNVEPGPLNEGEAAALNQLKQNAAQCSNIRPTNMDPEPGEGGTGYSCERQDDWQMLSDEEKEKFENRKNGHPKN